MPVCVLVCVSQPFVRFVLSLDLIISTPIFAPQVCIRLLFPECKFPEIDASRCSLRLSLFIRISLIKPLITGRGTVAGEGEINPLLHPQIIISSSPGT